MAGREIVREKRDGEMESKRGREGKGGSVTKLGDGST